MRIYLKVLTSENYYKSIIIIYCNMVFTLSLFLIVNLEKFTYC